MKFDRFRLIHYAFDKLGFQNDAGNGFSLLQMMDEDNQSKLKELVIGYYYSRPVPREDILLLLRNGRYYESNSMDTN